MEELNQSVEPEAVDLAPLGLPCLATISSRLVRVDYFPEGRGLPTGEVESPKNTRNVGVGGSRLLGSLVVKVRLRVEEAKQATIISVKTRFLAAPNTIGGQKSRVALSKSRAVYFSANS